MATASSDAGPSKPPSAPRGVNSSTDKYKGYIAGTASGLTKLTIGHPFDGIKVRLQCSPPGTFTGPIDAFLQLARRESILGLYKGASPPAVGWAISDSVLLGTLHNLRVWFGRMTGTGGDTGRPLPLQYHCLAGLGAGWTNCFITTPIENLKTLLQMQTHRVSVHLPGRPSGTGPPRLFTGPIDAALKVTRLHGPLGLWRTLPATLLFRANFAVMFGSFEFFNRKFASLKGTSWEISPGWSTFLSGGLAAELYWITALPADAVKNLMMADHPHPHGTATAAATATTSNSKNCTTRLYPPPSPKSQLAYPTLRSAWLQVSYHRPGGANATMIQRVRSVYTGLTPCLLRAFPTNAAALFVFEKTMELLGAEKTVTR